MNSLSFTAVVREVGDGQTSDTVDVRMVGSKSVAIGDLSPDEARWLGTHIYGDPLRVDVYESEGPSRSEKLAAIQNIHDRMEEAFLRRGEPMSQAMIDIGDILRGAL